MTEPPRRNAPALAGEIPSLDGLRAFSFLVVFVSHAGLRDVIPGGFGVTVFFFLSGFLITTLLRIERERHGRIHLGDFYVRRALRILPPFYLVLALAVALAHAGVLGGVPRAGSVAAVALHYGNYWIIRHGEAGLPAGTVVYWSLAVEEHFYLLFPWILEGLYRLRTTPARRAAVLLAGCAAILVWRLVLVHGHAGADRTFMGSDTRFDSILFGCALAIAANPALERPPGTDTLWRRVLLPLGLAGLVFAFVYRAPDFRETWRYTLQGLALIPVFVVAIRQPGWGPMRVLNWRPVKFVGVLSYVLYLVHYVMLHAFSMHTHWPPLPAALAALAASLAVAWAVHRAVERPLAALRRRLSHATAPAPAPGR
jgi:peptidoglycan/LPS O-acetylase OafA/YrhL